MTDNLKPENKALVERVLGYGTARTYNRHEIDRIIDAARQEGRCSPGEGGDDYSETIPCPICGGNDDNQQLMCEACGGAGLLGSIEPPASSSPSSGEVREAVARIIDPDAWSMSDKIGREFQAARLEIGREVHCSESLDKADAILALIPTSDEAALPEPVGFTGSGSLAALKAGSEGFIWPTKKASHPVALYGAPQSSTELPADVVRLETGWLIEEFSTKTNEFKARWWDGEAFTKDSDAALRFARRQDAQRYIDDIGWTEAVPTEHSWG